MFRSPSPASTVAKAKPRSYAFKNKHNLNDDNGTVKLENGITVPAPKPLSPKQSTPVRPQTSKSRPTANAYDDKKRLKKRPTTALDMYSSSSHANEEEFKTEVKPLFDRMNAMTPIQTP